MRSRESWTPSKFLPDPVHDTWVPNPAQVGIGSRYIAGLQIVEYERLLREHARGRLLDCGCGTVPYYGIYKDRIDDNVCIDWDNSLHPNRFIDHSVDLNGRLPFPEETFDTVLLSDVLEHVARPLQLMAEISRVLRRGGRLVLMVPFLYCIHEAPFDFYRYTEFALRRFCQQTHLSIVELTPYGGYLDVLLDLINKVLIKSEASLRYYLKGCRWVRKTARYGRIRESSSSVFPLGYCLVAEKCNPAPPQTDPSCCDVSEI